MPKWRRRSCSRLFRPCPYLNQSLRSYFSQQPAYVLREDASTGEALAKKYAKGIEVKPGEIVIPFTH